MKLPLEVSALWVDEGEIMTIFSDCALGAMASAQPAIMRNSLTPNSSGEISILPRKMWVKKLAVSGEMALERILSSQQGMTGFAADWLALREQAEEKLTQLKGVPLVAVSGLTGEGLDRLMQAIVDAYDVWNKRIPTSGLNRWFEHAVSAHPPPAVSGRSLRLNYITQAKSRPPSFVIFCTRADAVPDVYKRYLLNSLRETFDLPGTPIRLTLREKDNPYKGRAKRKH